MADEHDHQKPVEVEGEVKDRGLFDFMGRKKSEEEDEKKAEDKLVSEFEKVEVEEPHELKKVEEEEKEHKHTSMLEKLHDSSSSSSSDEEEGGEGEKKEKKKKKKKGLKEKLKEKVCGHEHKEAEQGKPAAVAVAHHGEDDTTVPVEKVEAATTHAAENPEEKKGFLEKIKDKLPGGHKKPEEGAPAVTVTTETHVVEQGKEHDGEAAKEKKGLLGKIMDKIPGYHKSEGGEHAGGDGASATH